MKDLEDLLPRRSNMPDPDEQAGQKSFKLTAVVSFDHMLLSKVVKQHLWNISVLKSWTFSYILRQT